MSDDETVRGSVVIPAHNEALVIRRCIEALHDGSDLSQVEVIVVCNGCTDETAELARCTGRPVQVLETPVASKITALRMADEAATSFPRIYLDADIVLRGAAALAVLSALDTEEAIAGRPPIRYDASHATWPVRSYYRARERIPVVRNALWGAGVFAMSESARARFGEFPDVVGDDLFVDSLFGADERVIVETTPVVVTTPARLGALVTILRRTYRGNAEQRIGGDADESEHTTPAHPTSSEVARQVLSSARSLGTAFDAIMYLAIAVTARAVTALGTAPRWERDDSSREARR